MKQVRIQLEFAVASWHPGLTSEDRLRIERVQKSACCIILGQEYKSYRKALKILELETLYERRKKLCRTFAKKAQKHTKFAKWFKPNIKKSCTRTKPTRFCEVAARTDRFRQSPISYLTNILNITWQINQLLLVDIKGVFWCVGCQVPVQVPAQNKKVNK